MSHTLWMGDLEPYMDEMFLQQAFQSMGESVLNVKLIRDKVTRVLAGYCFLDFSSPEEAQSAMLKLNGKIVPNTVPPKRFKLNSASYGKEHLLSPEFSLFVGDLTEDVDDLKLYTAFSKKYKSIKGAKVVIDSSGCSKGFGFVRFSEQAEQRKALSQMQYSSDVGKKPIRVSLATPKRPQHSTSGNTSDYSYNNQDYSLPKSHQYTQGYHSGWQYNPGPTQYNYYQDYTTAYGDYNTDPSYTQTPAAASATTTAAESTTTTEDETLVDPEVDMNFEAAHQEYMKHSEELYEVLEDSRWQILDSITSKIPIAAQVSS
ncbi:unnamed protein product [Owenia fusiformis]|uniref:tRNA selenocysteine-associated protein 1 n=1 Tax=Owenia fusiformis TaxID=6347 RepID=A0A8S4N1N1_OWEFU|nr:unnamed protein product [Owenia fusiformis]